LISGSKIDISLLTPELLNIFTPLLAEMEELAQTLDKDEFVDASMRLYETLKIPEKDLLITASEKWDNRRAKDMQNYSF